MSEEIELNDLDINKEEEHEEDEEDETNFEGDDDFDLLDSLTWLQHKGQSDNKQEKFFGNRDRYLQARNIAFLNNYALLLEEECNNSKFVKFLMDKKGFNIEKRIDGLLTNYKFLYSTEKDVGSNTIYYIDKQFKTEDGQLNQNDFEECRTEIREYYDEWRKEELKF